MRFFYSKFWKYLVCIYLVGVLIFGSKLFMRQIPSQMYVEKGQKIDKNINELVVLKSDEKSAEVFSEAKRNCRLTCYLFGLIPIKDVEVTVRERQSIYPSGRLIGIYEKSTGVLVLDVATITDSSGDECRPAEGIIQKGDYIEKINGIGIVSKKQLSQMVARCGESKLELVIKREGKRYIKTIKPVLTDEDAYAMGIWVKDDMAGIGTMTFYKKDGTFGALGHGIGDGVTGDLLKVSSGYIYNMDLSQVIKGERGTPGEISGVIHYSRRNRLGRLEGNSDKGIYGLLEDEDRKSYAEKDEYMEEAFKQEIEEGEAYIISDISGRQEKYRIEILEIDYDVADSNKGLLIKVTDERLIAATGGIIQGMSGSPIIQNNRVIGAVTHVLVNEPTEGYGIFIENMLEKCD